MMERWQCAGGLRTGERDPIRRRVHCHCLVDQREVEPLPGVPEPLESDPVPVEELPEPDVSLPLDMPEELPEPDG